MSYSRIKGMQYAKEHINKFKEQYPEYDIQNNKHTDCANFASQVLHEGGVAFSYGKGYSDWWCDYRKGANPRGKGAAWSDVQSLRRALLNNYIKDVRVKKLSSAHGLKEGDLIFLIRENKTAHHVMIVGETYNGGNDILIYQRGTADPQNRIKRKQLTSNMLFVHILDNEANDNPPSTSNWQERYGAVTLKLGSSGEYVKNMQLDLSKLGYNAGKADGKFGKGTLNAVKDFQERNGLTKDGLFGKNSKIKLYELAFNNGASALKSEAKGSESVVDKIEKGFFEKDTRSIEERVEELEERVCLLEDKITEYEYDNRNN